MKPIEDYLRQLEVIADELSRTNDRKYLMLALVLYTALNAMQASEREFYAFESHVQTFAVLRSTLLSIPKDPPDDCIPTNN